MATKVMLKVDGVPANFPTLPFGRQLEYWRIIERFKATAKVGHVSQKRQSSRVALRDFLRLNNVSQYYAQFHDSEESRDDTYQIWYV